MENRSCLLVWVIILALFAWLFAEVIFLPRCFVYRDAAHFYYPLFEYTAREWAAGRIPLWNPHENGGMPLLANATASVLYPGKLVFALPLEFSVAYRAYILGHVLLAAAGAFFLARRWQMSTSAAALVALSYAFCGNVLFQYCNVVFLCGAAWFPFALWSGDRMLRERSYPWAVVTGGILALMTLAGDPQSAYHAGLLLAGYSLLLWWTGEPPASDARERQSRWQRLRQHRFALLAATALSGIALAAVQVLPTYSFSKRTVRAHYDVPRSLWEIPAYAMRRSPPLPRADTGRPPRWYDGLLGNPPPPGGHHDQIYQFSVGPWRLAGYLWPNVGGQQFPVNRRWLEVLPAEGAVWVPSFYMGLVPLVLAVAALRFRRGDVRIRWMSWTVVLSALASFGGFGLVWMLREGYAWMVLAATGELPATPSDSIGHEVGGLYWLLTVLLPGYVQFRYPAKWLTVAALGLSLLAGWKWDRLPQENARLPRVFFALAMISGVGVVVTLAIAPFWSDWMANVPADAYFGPLDADGAWRDLLFAFLQTAIVAALVGCMLARTQNGSGSQSVRASTHPTHYILLLVLAMDLGVANRWMIASAACDAWQTPSRVGELIAAAEREHSTGEPAEPFRVHRLEGPLPEAWQKRSSSQRQREGLQWDRDTLFPKYHLQQGISLAETAGTMKLFDYGLLLSASQRPHPDGGTEYVQPRRALDAWNVKYFILPRGEQPHDPQASSVGLRRQWLKPRWSPERPQGAPLGEPLPSLIEDPQRFQQTVPGVEVLDNPSHLPRAWIVHHLLPLAPLEPHDRRTKQALVQAMVYPADRFIDLRETAVIESRELFEQFQSQGMSELSAPRPDGESCRIVHYDPQRVEIDVHLKALGAVVLSDTYDSGWVLEVEENGRRGSAAVYRTNLLMRGAVLQPGRYRLIYSYRPFSFYFGWIVSTLAWVAAALWLGRRAWRASVS